MGVMMMDMKKLIILQEQQQRDTMDKLEEQRDTMDKLEQQQRDTMDKLEQQVRDAIDEIKQEQHEMMDKIEEQNRDIDVIKTLVKHEAIQRGCDGSFTFPTTLYVNDSSVQMLCDGAGWVVMLRRVDNQYNFSTNGWNKYKYGFGDPSGSFFLGLENIHQFTSQGQAKLWIDFEDFNGVTRWLEYSSFHIRGENSGYELMISGKTGNATDSFLDDNGRRFTTMDRDNDLSTTSNCAESMRRPWWYGTGCSQAAFTGVYDENGKGIFYSYPQKIIEMKIRLE